MRGLVGNPEDQFSHSEAHFKVITANILERFREVNSGYSGYKSAHAHKCTRVVQSRTFRVINKMATSYGYGWKQTVLGNETRYSLKL